MDPGGLQTGSLLIHHTQPPELQTSQGFENWLQSTEGGTPGQHWRVVILWCAFCGAGYNEMFRLVRLNNFIPLCYAIELAIGSRSPQAFVPTNVQYVRGTGESKVQYLSIGLKLACDPEQATARKV